ncbi:MAG: N-acetylglucosamine-6-phosphate deacetylase [Meiothermus sp.]|nr:N-acetylglucosamine-6-phosphate deacetylase [Meiothermus sp.]MCS7059079.1 N-acetylglucosamine-6-phosphate deacetylase [Meiothermus sp.]MCS7195549.1 N-acetylglucosamine-6-phosphate deacetylase [Meiothermus sp.]MCX7740698.1 N-acetylglucosamine-6-phosphate deacetylase [Meiothermus sp.]MDW8090477.1 N-acetylglucosamine-6-phosphate deacetylase [Meiothermus sp.]MDW8481022.1 N-acetylglucosamine-6-phosphate deacetylase [Meiothermus sp.]
MVRAIVPLGASGPSGRRILPGLVDLHVHGGGGADVMGGEAALRRMARFHAQHGTTALLATTVTAPLEDLEAALLAVRAVMQEPRPGEARVVGVHLEGPFIHPERLGAQPPYPLLPDLGVMERLLALAPVRVVTLAPELPGALELIAFLRARGVRVQQGHTRATYEEARAALEAGAEGFTHLLNAMSPLHHRAPGVVGLALERGIWAEVIPDGLHLHPAVLRLLARALPQVYAVTDAVAAAGMPEGEYRLGRLRVIRRAGGVFLPNGALAGSTLTQYQALRNLLRWGFSLVEAVDMTALRPARYLGLAEGLTVGGPADMLVLDENFDLEEVYIAGRPVPRT